MKQNEAVLHMKVKSPEKVILKSGQVYTTMMANKERFPEAASTMEALRTESDKLAELVDSDNGTKLSRATILVQTDVVIVLLKELLFYVNKAAQGDKVIILSSGFDCNNEPVPLTEVPGRAVIRRVDDGAVSCSVKAFMNPVPGADRYKLEVATDLNNPNWVTYTDHASFNSIEAKDLQRGKEIMVRVTAGNSCGWGEPSEPASFIPR